MLPVWSTCETIESLTDFPFFKEPISQIPVIGSYFPNESSLTHIKDLGSLSVNYVHHPDHYF